MSGRQTGLIFYMSPIEEKSHVLLYFAHLVKAQQQSFLDGLSIIEITHPTSQG